MSRFIQIHALTSYPPSNPNRDDQGRPKTAMVGGALRLRISSQSLKRAMRTSVAFQSDLGELLGDRTRMIGDVILNALLEKGHPEEAARNAAADVASIFGKVDDPKGDEARTVQTNQLVFVSKEEQDKAITLAERVLAGEVTKKKKKNADDDDETTTGIDTRFRKDVLNAVDRAADIGMFGRMLADAPEYNRDAAVQVSHAITTHAAVIEDDFFTAVDDLQTRSDEAGAGAGMMGEQGFGSGVYYVYATIDVAQLLKNLGPSNGVEDVAQMAVSAFVDAVATACPTGKQNSFANRPRASYLRVEIGDQQPRDLSGAFFKPVRDEDMMRTSIESLETMAEKLDRAYGPCADDVAIMDITRDTGSLRELKAFAGQAVPAQPTRSSPDEAA